ncbi:MAG: acyltransferase [Pseudomonadota bacterium]
MQVSRQLKTVQALRGIAALLVMMGHLHTIEARQSGALEAGKAPLLSEIWINGASGVDLFFVISGFIMVWVAGSAPAGPSSAVRFAVARVFRIYPLWWLFAGVTALYLWLTYGVAWDTAQLEQRGMQGPEYLLRSALLLPQGWLPVLNVGWTLVHEMYFYLVFAVLLFLPASWRGFALIVWGGLVLTFAAQGYSSYHAGTAIELATHPMTLEFLMGAGVAYLIGAERSGFERTALVLGLIALGASFAVFPYFRIFNEDLGWYRIILFGLPSALVLYGFVQLELKHGFGRLVPSFLVRLGDWSYALYLSHILVLSAAGRIWFSVLEPDWNTRAGFIVASIAIAICASALAYYLYERPIIRLGKNRMGARANSVPSRT